MNYLIKRILSLCIAIITVFTLSAQDSRDSKKIKKCWKVYHKKGVNAGLTRLKDYMATQIKNTPYAHESLIVMEYEKYLKIKEAGLEGYVNNKKAGKLDINAILKGNEQESDLIAACRRGTIEATSPTGDRIIHSLLVHEDPDTLISEKAKLYFEEGKTFFEKQDYELAKMNFIKALQEDSNYYKPLLYLGESMAFEDNADSAFVYYQLARKLKPNMLEPRIYIINYLTEKGLYYRAKKESLEALTIYPGFNMKYKLNGILDVENKYMNERRITRTFYSNSVTREPQNDLSNMQIWRDYRLAREMAVSYCSKDGIISDNEKIEDHYLEVYSYRYMLNKNQHDLPEFLHFADKMKEEGFLEPYVFISQFHFDLYPQFKHYMSIEENRNKAIEYIEKYVITPKPSY
ncbi:tetratricopeptide repeat protein [Crocinitomix algicola]|uniref:hypothetical protein n=1 Tax=Crocinitomix algicola TaxID=1740263 RepID=UPI00082E1192|nr:hypothetical protein [Crocinitomix algicola]